MLILKSLNKLVWFVFPLSLSNLVVEINGSKLLQDNETRQLFSIYDDVDKNSSQNFFLELSPSAK